MLPVQTNHGCSSNLALACIFHAYGLISRQPRKALYFCLGHVYDVFCVVSNPSSRWEPDPPLYPPKRSGRTLQNPPQVLLCCPLSWLGHIYMGSSFVEGGSQRLSIFLEGSKEADELRADKELMYRGI
ncbi:hypothetical protein HZ326_28162 [Fusarium oxysporum f. sp. albedinis]|nr:hypothetical protein HZ326_28162 [Fusarium oxysporum f. sp. albedinis]